MLSPQRRKTTTLLTAVFETALHGAESLIPLDSLEKKEAFLVLDGARSFTNKLAKQRVDIPSHLNSPLTHKHTYLLTHSMEQSPS